MYIPAAFRETRLETLHALIREHSFGTLVSHVQGQLFATHLPFILDAGRNTLRGHMARANPHWRDFSGGESLVIFQGAHAYISPAWYISQLTVPTWNYEVVHVYGVPSLEEDPTRVRELLEQTVCTFDAAGWSTAKVPEEYLANMQKAIVAFEIPINRIQGKRKLGQNRSVEDALSAAAGLRATGDETGAVVAEAMIEAAHARQ
jgi:transcriptional regulator